MATCANEGCDKAPMSKNAKFCSTQCRHDNWNRQRRVGRPRPRRAEPLTAETAPVLNLRVPEDLYEALGAVAQREGIPRAVVARRAMAAYVEAEGVRQRAS